VLTSAFDYELARTAIAQQPLDERDSARLLVADGLQDAQIRDLPSFLETGDLLVVNATRVRRARLHGHRDNGGKLEILLLGHQGNHQWAALALPARKLRQGQKVWFGGDPPELVATVIDDQGGGIVVLELEAEPAEVEAAVERWGVIPLPPYITESIADPERYQTIYADRVGSAAAPTAGLHFTRRLLAELEQAGIGVAKLELEIGIDTFRPIASLRLEDHRMHSERYSIPEGTVDQIRTTHKAGGRVVAVGTTVVRALEASANQHGEPRAGKGVTDLFATPGFRFRVVDRLLTNFHLPRSSLLVLVAAFTGESWRQIYQHALSNQYRFLSFGDAVLVDRHD